MKLVVALIGLLGCAPEPGKRNSSDTSASPIPAPMDTGTPIFEPPPFYGEPLDDIRLLRRLSLDLRGIPPSIDELDRVEADAAALGSILEEYLIDPRYSERLVHIFGELLLTRKDQFSVTEYDYGQMDVSFAQEFVRSVGEEPLRLMAHVATSDRPWTDVVTANMTVANEMLSQIWPIDRPEGEGWQISTYTDGRPAGGVLMTNGLWWRYYTTPNNFGRSRANALSKLFLCEDFLSRPIKFQASAVASVEDINDATRADPSCASCHSTLDPLSSILFGFWWFDLHDVTEMTSYHPDRENLGAYYLGMEPAYFGVPINGAAALGSMIANDDRFIDCTVEQAASVLWDRQPDLTDFATLQELRATFEAGGLVHRTLVRAIVDSNNYRVGSVADGAPDDTVNRLRTQRLLNVDQFASSIKHLTGFTWTWESWDQLDNDLTGYRVLAGGINSHDVMQPERSPTLSQALVHKRVAQLAGGRVVQEDLIEEDEEPVLFRHVELATDRPEHDNFTNELIHLHRSILSTRPSEDDLEAHRALWLAVEEQSDPAQAWASVVAVLLRDPSFWVY